MRTPLVRPALLLALALFGCKPNSTASSNTLLSDVKAGLDARDRKLTSYSLEGLTAEAGQEARFTFEFRAPGKMKGSLTAPAERTFSFDGKTLFDLNPAAKAFTRINLEPQGQAGSLLLHQIFGSFVSEGYRAPLIAREGLSAERTTHAKASDAVKLTQTASEGTKVVTVTYVLRLPAYDFVEKTVTSPEGTVQWRVEEEHCEGALKLCVPKKLSRWDGDQQTATTTLSAIALNPPIPSDALTLTSPEGFTEQTRALQ